MEREAVAAREPSGQSREAREHLKLDVDHGQAEFATVREVHAVDFVEAVAQDVDGCHVLTSIPDHREPLG